MCEAVALFQTHIYWNQSRNKILKKNLCTHEFINIKCHTHTICNSHRPRRARPDHLHNTHLTCDTNWNKVFRLINTKRQVMSLTGDMNSNLFLPFHSFQSTSTEHLDAKHMGSEILHGHSHTTINPLHFLYYE